MWESGTGTVEGWFQEAKENKVSHKHQLRLSEIRETRTSPICLEEILDLKPIKAKNFSLWFVFCTSV